MAAKNKRTAIRDFHEALGAHIEANRLAHEWAEKCLAYRQAGKTAQARAAEGKARQWLRKVIAFEAWAASGKPQGGRSGEK
jgi:hypothetical protein